MAGNEKFWVSLQLGKWRAEAIQKIFSGRLTILLMSATIAYSGLFLYFILLAPYIPIISDIDFLTPISTLLGFALAIFGIGLGFQSYFIQQRAKPEVITYCGIIDYQNARTLITFLNKGETVAIRNISLLAMRDRKDLRSRLRARMWGIPSFDIFTEETIFQGWKILREGECAGVLEEDIKKATNEIELRIQHEKDVENLYISIMAFDEEFDITKPQSINETVLAGCKLGDYLNLIKYATGEEKEFPGLVSGYKTYLKMPEEDFKRFESGKGIRVKFIGEVPPSVVDMDFEIWRKLDSIEKLLSGVIKKNKKKTRKEKSQHSRKT